MYVRAGAPVRYAELGGESKKKGLFESFGCPLVCGWTQRLDLRMLGTIDLLNQAPVTYGHDGGLESPLRITRPSRCVYGPEPLKLRFRQFPRGIAL